MLRLKEKPSEWIKFTAVMGLSLNLVLWLLYWKGHLAIGFGGAAAGLAIVAVITAMLQPHWFRSFYRVGMTVSFQIGQFMGKVLLSFFFFLIVTPMGLLLRLLGKDLLELKRNPDESTRWRRARNNRDFDRMF